MPHSAYARRLKMTSLRKTASHWVTSSSASASASAALSRWGGCRGTTDVLMIFLQPSLSYASLRVLARGSSVHSLMLSCQHFLGLPRLLPPGTVPCMMVFASPVARVTCPYHLSFLVLTIERRSSCGPMAALTRFLTSSFVILSLNEMPKIFL